MHDLIIISGGAAALSNTVYAAGKRCVIRTEGTRQTLLASTRSILATSSKAASSHQSSTQRAPVHVDGTQ